MRLYNVEFFNKSLEYVGAQQVPAFNFEYDYLSPTASTIELLTETQVEVGNIVNIKSFTDSETFSGIVTSVTVDKTKKVKFKPLISIFDVYTIIGQYTSVEDWFLSAIRANFEDNADTLQNWPCIVATKTSTTTGNLGETDASDMIINMYDVCVYALKTYGIAVNFSLDLRQRKMLVTIGRVVALPRTIEADLPNVLDKNIVIKTNDSSANKETIVNKNEDGLPVLTATYYRDQEGNITQNPTTRITPVVFTYSVIDTTEDEFAKAARERAERDLVPPAYNNLIEITVQEDDDLVNAGQYKIGQNVQIINGDTIYNTIYTGMSKKNGTTILYFGAIRLELTKILKRRLK